MPLEHALSGRFKRRAKNWIWNVR